MLPALDRQAGGRGTGIAPRCRKPMAIRLKLESVDLRIEGLQLEARVGLSLNGDLRFGAVRGQLSEDARQRLIAEATLKAVSLFTGRSFFLSLDSVAEIRSGRHPIVVVTMLMDDGSRQVFFSGTAPISDEGSEAAARAVLNGLNRWLEPLLEREMASDAPRIEQGRALH